MREKDRTTKRPTLSTLDTSHPPPPHPHTLHFTVCILHTTLQTPMLCTPTLHTSHSTLAFYTLHWTPHITPHSKHFTLYTLRFTLHFTHTHTLNTSSTLHTPHCILHNLHFTLCTAQHPSTLCTPCAVEMPTQMTFHTFKTSRLDANATGMEIWLEASRGQWTANKAPPQILCQVFRREMEKCEIAVLDIFGPLQISLFCIILDHMHMSCSRICVFSLAAGWTEASYHMVHLASESKSAKNYTTIAKPKRDF